MQAIYIVELQLNTLLENQYYSNSLQYPALFKKLLWRNYFGDIIHMGSCIVSNNTNIHHTGTS